MRKRTVRAALAAGVLAAGAAFFVDIATGAASGATTPADPQRHAIDGYHADRMVVDGVRRRLLIADDVAHRIRAVGYDGTVADETALPDGANAGDLQLSADSTTLWATLPDAQMIISWNAATLDEIARYPVAVLDLGHLTLAGDRAWFTYNKNYFGSLDPATGEVAKYVLGDGNDSSANPRQPLIAASPADPNRLALTYAGTRTTLFLYDISGDTAALVTKTQTGTMFAHSALEYTADGRMIYVSGIGGVFYTWADDLDTSQARTIAMNQAVDVEAASNGWIAAGLPPATDATDLRLFQAGETVPAREFDIPTATGAPALADLAWEPGGGRLFAVTSDQDGAQNLWVIDAPTVAPAPSTPARTATAIKLTAPATAGRGSGINVQGTLGGGLPMGTPVKAVRTDAESPAGVEVRSSDTNAQGEFSFIDSPAAGGTITYTVSYAGDATHKPSSAKVSIEVARTATALTLNRNGSINAYGATVAMTAHLGATYQNRTVELWADPYGADRARSLIKKGTVDGSGNLSVNYKLTRNTTFSAVFAGDTRYAARTIGSAVKTKVAVSTTVAKHYRLTKSYYYVRKATNPTFTTTMTAYPGRSQRLTFERYSGGKWVAWKTSTLKLSSAGKYTFTLTGTHATGVKYRVRAAYLTGTSGDSANYSTYGSWKYFTFTK
ncbi:hypothetical protein [Actinoplanes sp. NPDC026623]|uniref:hypothetical protein n=1 Tax=Actinoplanes sp. NPDC026623 TaxID=3155610 RepID=UPI0033C25AE0